LWQTGEIVPIINENDSVAVEELRFGDNDRLSSEVAILAHADLLVILTSVEGLLQPVRDGHKLVKVVRDVDAVAGYATNTTGSLSVGGMVSKLQAVKVAVQAGVPVIIASGRTPGVISAAAGGRSVGTRFVPAKQASR
jgi:glutamate 5-kinase